MPTAQTAISVNFHGEELVLDGEQAVYVKSAQALLVADIHLGKSATFRAHGIPLPEGDGEADLQRLLGLVRRYEAASVYILGDLLHGPDALSQAVSESFVSWREKLTEVAVYLVPGNHDRRSLQPPVEWSLQSTNAVLPLGPLTLVHDANHVDESVNGVVSGHIHPAVRLSSGARADALAAACFWMSPHRLVLPSFGSFTGGYRIRPAGGDRVFLVEQGVIVEAPVAICL